MGGDKIMMDQNFFSPYSQPAAIIESPKFDHDLMEEIRALLEKHGIRIEEKPTSCILYLPPGTTKTEIFPRVHNSRYRIDLPDGFVFYENELIWSLSVIRLPLDQFSEEIQKKYRG